MTDRWTSGDHYERYMGRWSRLVAREFIDWLDRRPESRWLDVGCGTGALSQTILERARPRDVIGIDASPDYVAAATAKGLVAQVANAMELPFADQTFDVAVSGLVLNFVPDPAGALAEMQRVARVAAFYVWDYAAEMQFLRRFWDAALAIDPNAPDEGRRFPFCDFEQLAHYGEVHTIVVPTTFASFDDLWDPFTSGQGPAPGYVASLDATRRDALRERLRASLPISADGSIALTARAWAVHGR